MWKAGQAMAFETTCISSWILERREEETAILYCIVVSPTLNIMMFWYLIVSKKLYIYNNINIKYKNLQYKYIWKQINIIKLGAHEYVPAPIHVSLSEAENFRIPAVVETHGALSQNKFPIRAVVEEEEFPPSVKKGRRRPRHRRRSASCQDSLLRPEAQVHVQSVPQSSSQRKRSGKSSQR